MLELILLAGTGAVTLWGYLTSRKFVRERLRFVDAAHTLVAPLIAGAVAALAAVPVVLLLPLIGVPTALIFGLGVGTGVYHGSREVRRQLPPA